MSMHLFASSNSRWRRRNPLPSLALMGIALGFGAPASVAAPEEVPRQGKTPVDVDNLVPSSDAEPQVRTRAGLRRAELRYRARRIDVREDDTGEIGFYLGDSQVKLDGGSFYARVGQQKLADEFRTNAGLLNLVTLGGLSTAVASEGAALGILLAGLAGPELLGVGLDATVLSVVTGGLLLSVAGLVVGISSMGFDPSPTTAQESAALAHDYNRRLRRELDVSGTNPGPPNSGPPIEIASVPLRSVRVDAASLPSSKSHSPRRHRNRQPHFAANAKLQE